MRLPMLMPMLIPIAPHSLLNGRPSPYIDSNERGLAYGDGLFETIKVDNSGAQFLDAHLQRLALGCQRLKLYCPIDMLRREIDQLLAMPGPRPATLKLIISRASTGRGYRPGSHAGSLRLVSLSASHAAAELPISTGVDLRLCDHRLPINPALAGLKHLCRLDNVIASAEADGGVEGLMLDAAGRLVEGTMSNVFLVIEGRLLTPALHRCGVAGVIRQLILERLASREALVTEVKDLKLADLYRAEEVFICNSIIGIVPVRAIGCHHKSAFTISLRLQRQLQLECAADA